MPEECLVEDVPRKCLIQEKDRYKKCWDIWILFCVLYVAFVMVYRMSLDIPPDTKFTILEAITDLSFLIDIILTFFTEVYVESKFLTVRNHKEIALIYLKGWFALDLISIIPFQLIL